MKNFSYLMFGNRVLLFLLLSIILSAQAALGQKLAVSADSSEQAIQALKGHNNLAKVTKIYDQRHGGSQQSRPPAVGDNAIERHNYQLEMLRDPATGELPSNIHKKELRFAKRLNRQYGLAKSASSRVVSPWQARGPYNVGGRTRALAIDLDNENVIIAGGVSGGMWRSENGGATWQKTTGTNDIQSVTAVVQDPRPGHRNVWYYSTGERIGNSASAGGAFFAGNGIFKSVDGGKSWKPLSSTADDQPQSYSPFDLIFNLAVNPLNGDLYVATWVGIYRSSNGGNSFDSVLEAGVDNWTDITITPQGKIYATITSTGNPNKGIFRSENGNTWESITPASFPQTYGRVVLDYTKTNENIVYILADNPTTGGAYLWKYTHDPANAVALNNRWTNLSANLPAIGGSVGSLNTQGGYNLFVKVHPTNPNAIFIGGTNLYRSMTGFTTSAGQESWIGGYATVNNVSVYPNHHPDQHALVFFPSNPNKALSGNDGGVQVTENILASAPGNVPVEWISLNNGYLTTQPYVVSFNPAGTDDEQLLAGFQDNGTWNVTSNNPTDAWGELFSGDGSYNAIADNGLVKYVSSQRGNIYRFDYATTNAGVDDYVSYRRITPAGATGFAFVAPFILDPNNDNIMYLAAGDRIWRNDDLDGIPAFSMSAATVNWNNLSSTQVPAGQRVTALAISRMPANRLYYGTNTGGIYRVDNANIGSMPKKDLSTGKNLPTNAYINSIEVDPANADRVFVVFSNYNVRSIFYSEDGGETWTDISGNLEQNADGSGNGPSVRWFAVKGNSDGYLVGTSTGLYSTTKLEGDNTVWTQENVDGIGNVVVSMVKTREDGFVAVATHGNGLYSARFEVTPLPQPKLSIAKPINNYEVFKNSPATILNVSKVFAYDGGEEIKLSVINTNPDLVTATLKDGLLVVEYKAEALGEATIALVASAGKEEITEPFKVTIKQLNVSLYAQNGPVVGTRPSQLFTDFGNSLAQIADDFTIPAGQTWYIEKIDVQGAANRAPAYKDVRIVVYKDNNGTPGEEVYTTTVTPESGLSDPNFALKLAQPLELTEGTFWLSVFIVHPYSGGNQWFWRTQGAVAGNEAMFKDANDLFGAGATSWTKSSAVFGGPSIDQVFVLYGKGTGIPAPNAPTQLIATYESETAFKLNWTDNADNEIAYVIERSTNGTTFKQRTIVAADQTMYVDTDFFNRKQTFYYRVAAIGVSDISAYSNIDTMAVVPLAPILKPAANVKPRSFIAKWTPSDGASYYLLDVSNDGFETFLPGYENRVVKWSSHFVFGTKPNLTYQYRMRAVNVGGVSPYSETMEIAPIKNLNLTSVCSDDPATVRRWRVTNPNPFAVEVEWKVYDAQTSGIIVAEPGYTYFTTEAVSGPNTTLITWQDDKGSIRAKVKESSGAECSVTSELADGMYDDSIDTKSPGLVNAWPNPSNGKFSVLIATPEEGDVKVQLVNSQGVRVRDAFVVPGNTIMDWDLTNYPAGIYILRIEQGSYTEIVRLIKQ